MKNIEDCSVSYDEKHKIILLKWNIISFGRDYRKFLTSASEMMKKNCCQKMVLDLTEGFDNEFEDTEWVYKEFINTLANLDAESVYFVINKSNKLNDEIKNESSKQSKYFKIHACQSLDNLTENI